MQTTVEANVITFTIDGKQVKVPKGTTVYHAAKKMGIDLPIFCYHDRMPPFGACRVCLVEVENMPKLQTSCTLEATEGMVVKTQSNTAVDGRKGILEFLLINHPLDCPICDRGGECPLQDQTLSHGPGESRFFEDKRRFKKRVPLGPVLMLDRERCIACARCTRFGDIVSGDHALEFNERGFKTEISTPDGGPAESKFIGNTIQICPVGALTSQVYRFRARPWDNTSTASTCTLCPVGCSMSFDSRDGDIMRTRARENLNVNDVWLCDKGWFGYEFVNHSDRLKTPLIKKNGSLEPASWDEAIALVASKLKSGKNPNKIAGLGGNPLTTEECYLFQRLITDGCRSLHVDSRIGMPLLTLEEEGISAGMESSIGDLEQQSLALLLGIDLTEEFPILWLRLKKAINKGGKAVFIGHYAPEIDHHLSKTVTHAPGQELSVISEQLPQLMQLVEGGKSVTVLVGSQYLSSPHRKEILAKLLRLKQSHPNLTLNILEGRGNSMGARYAGMHPELGPMGQRLSQTGMNTLQVIEAGASGGWEILYVAGGDPAAHLPTHLWKDFRSKLDFLVVQDIFLTQTAAHADVVLPTLCYVEKKGTFVNIEGRIQKLQPGKSIPQELFSDGHLFMKVAHKMGFPISVDPVFEQKILSGRLPQQRNATLAEPASIRATNDQKKGETALCATFAHALFDCGTRMRHNQRVVKLAKEPHMRIHPSEGIKRGINEGDKVRVSVKNSAVTLKASLDKRVAEGTAVLPLGFEQAPVRELGANLFNGLTIELKKEVG